MEKNTESNEPKFQFDSSNIERTYPEISDAKVNEIVTAFKNSKWLHTYSYKRLEKTFGASYAEIAKAKTMFKTNDKIPPKEELVQTIDMMQVDRAWIRGDGKMSYQLSKKKNPHELEQMIEALKEALEEYNFAEMFAQEEISRPKKESGKTLVVCLFDLHLGKLALHNYTEGYDTSTGEIKAEFDKLYEKIIEINEISPITNIVIPIGNDLFHVDGELHTTSNGTPQDVDPDLYKHFKMGIHLSRYFIDCLKLIADVEVPIITGNHSRYTEMMLGVALSAIYRDNPHVKVDDSPNVRKYYKYGKTLLGFSHGEKKPDFYSRLLPFEAKQYFSECSNFYVLLGDKHHNDIRKSNVSQIKDMIALKEIDGVTILQLGALSHTDRWHHKEGYFSKRQSFFLLFDHDKGLEMQYNNIADLQMNQFDSHSSKE